MRTKEEILDRIRQYYSITEDPEAHEDFSQLEAFIDIRDQLKRIADYLDPQKDWSPKEFDVNKEIIERTLKEPDNK